MAQLTAVAHLRDLRDHIALVESAGKLVRIRRPINKDTELMPFVRLQFRGLPEEQRTAFLFERVTDAKGRTYGIPVVVGIMAASRQIYALSMGCEIGQLREKWAAAMQHPLPPPAGGFRPRARGRAHGDRPAPGWRRNRAHPRPHLHAGL